MGEPTSNSNIPMLLERVMELKKSSKNDEDLRILRRIEGMIIYFCL